MAWRAPRRHDTLPSLLDNMTIGDAIHTTATDSIGDAVKTTGDFKAPADDPNETLLDLFGGTAA